MRSTCSEAAFAAASRGFALGAVFLEQPCHVAGDRVQGGRPPQGQRLRAPDNLVQRKRIGIRPHLRARLFDRHMPQVGLHFGVACHGLHDVRDALVRLVIGVKDARGFRPCGKADVEIRQVPLVDAGPMIAPVPNDPDQAARALEAAGISYTKREVLIVRVLDAPGTLGDVALVMSHAGINIDSVYVTTGGHVVLGVDDIVGAIQVAGGMALMTS